MSSRARNSKKCDFSLAWKLDIELALQMSFGSMFQTFGAIMQNAHLAVSVRVHSTERRGTSLDRRDRVVTWRCWSSSMYSGTEVDRALRVMTAIFSTGCTVGQAVSKGTLVAIWRGHICADDI